MWQSSDQLIILTEFDTSVRQNNAMPKITFDDHVLPILRAKKGLTELKSGEVLRILATDPGSVKDFAAFSRQTGNDLLSSTENNKEFEFYMRRK